jgi:hypothetical protein
VNVADRSVTVCVCDPGCKVTRYPVIGVPPLYGDNHISLADESKTWTERPVGTDGMVVGTTDPDIVAAEVPTAFVALTLTLYAVP